MGAAAMAAALAVGTSVTGRPAAAAAERSDHPIDPPPPAVLLPAVAETPALNQSHPSLHGLPPEVFAARIESLSGILATR